MRKGFVLLAAWLSVGVAYGQVEQEKIVYLPEVLTSLKETIRRIQNSRDAMAQLPPMLSAHVTLKVGATVEEDQKFRFFIWRFGEATNTEVVQTLNITLTPMASDRSTLLEEGVRRDPTAALGPAIVDAAQAISEAEFAGLNLGIGSLKATVYFGVTTSNGTEWAVEILPDPLISAESGTVLSAAAIQQITIEFAY